MSRTPDFCEIEFLNVVKGYNPIRHQDGNGKYVIWQIRNVYWQFEDKRLLGKYVGEWNRGQ